MDSAQKLEDGEEEEEQCLGLQLPFHPVSEQCGGNQLPASSGPAAEEVPTSAVQEHRILLEGAGPQLEGEVQRA